MKIDLHCHTRKAKKGDGKGRNVTPELFKEKIELADVKIVAITNHNMFDYDQYIELRNVVAGICQVWPGVEIDIDFWPYIPKPRLQFRLLPPRGQLPLMKSCVLCHSYTFYYLCFASF